MFSVSLANDDCIFDSTELGTLSEVKEWIDKHGYGFRAEVEGPGIHPVKSELSNFYVAAKGRYKCYNGFSWYWCNPFKEISLKTHGTSQDVEQYPDPDLGINKNSSQSRKRKVR